MKTPIVDHRQASVCPNCDEWRKVYEKAVFELERYKSLYEKKGD